MLYDAELDRVATLVRDRAAEAPPNWQLDRASAGYDGQRWFNYATGQIVIWSVMRETDRRIWMHVSMSNADGVPSWDDLKLAKGWLIGPARYAYQVLPPEERYVNVNPRVLHLWAVVDGAEPLPDFVRPGGQL